MRLSPASLGLKLNLALVFFFLMLGGLTVVLILYGFNRTQDNAAARSEEALEEQGKLALKAVAGGAAESGALRFEAAAAIGHRASRFMESFDASSVTVAVDANRMVQASNGVWYDPDPDRISDVVVLNHPTLDDAALDDITYSAALDVLFPSLMEGFPGELSGEAYHPITIVFVGANSVGRTYPPLSEIEISVPQDFDVAAFINKFGPASNPQRRTIWTTPYEDRLGKGLVITAQTPVYQGDSFRGIFEVDLSIERLVQEVAEITPTASGFAFYVDNEGAILRTGANPLLLQELDSGSNVSLIAVVEAMAKGEAQEDVVVEKLVLGSREFFIAYAPFPGVGGSFAVAAPVDEVTAKAAAIAAGIEDEGRRTLQVTLLAMAALFVVGLAGATYLNRRVLLRPIGALVAGTRAVAEGDFETRVAVSGNDELATLGRSFNQMTAQIQREVQDREATQSELAALFAAMTDAVVVLNKEGRYLRVPSTNAPQLLMPPNDLLGRNMRDVMPAAQADEFMRIVDQALQEQRTATVEYPLEVDGTTYWFSAAVSPTSQEDVVVVARDITERVNARQELERQVEERTRELTALLGISNNVASTLELAPLLTLVIDEVKTIADYDRCSIFTLEGDRFVLLDSRSTAAGSPISLSFSLSTIEDISSHILRQEPVIIDDLRSDSPEAKAYQAGSGELFETAFKDIHSWMGVPLALKDRVIGMLTLSHTQSAFYTERHAELVGAIATQIAVAIENARLYEQAQQLAAVEERQRLARELHDSVSQALYGIALGARTARTLLDSEPARAVEPVDYVLSLAEAGLAEMRALIFELRPESLETEGLVEALQKQAAATQARYGLDVTADLGEEPSLSLPEKEVFYRVAQEAMHNVVKHAHAQHVAVHLATNNGSVVLEVRDDGSGFDTSTSFPGHMGLVSMRERAVSIGGNIDLSSTPNAGTTVRLSLDVN